MSPGALISSVGRGKSGQGVIIYKIEVADMSSQNWLIAVYHKLAGFGLQNTVIVLSVIRLASHVFYRWCNVLNPDIKLDTWTEEEDQTLRESVALHGPHRWSAIATDLKVRTDKQCWR